MTIIEALNWRYATKRMNGETVPKEDLACILEAIRLAPSSFGLQPYSIIVIENMELLKKVQPIANSQPQITEASALLVFAAWDNVTQERINDYITLVATTRNVTEDDLKPDKEEMEELLKNTAEDNFKWASKQAYIALGMGLTAAALNKIDTTPMEGFKNAMLDELLQLKERGLRSAALMAIGYRDEEHDLLVKLPKVRRAKEDIFITLQAEIGFTATHINSINNNI
ncbi:MAG: NAD(P)H-dependent oxidoreductase [Bacteroidota bacterium]